MATANEIKVPTTSAFSNGSITAEAGDVISIFTDDAAGLKGNESVKFYLDTADNDQYAFSLSGQRPNYTVSGRCNLIGKKGATTVAIGIMHYAA